MTSPGKAAPAKGAAGRRTLVLIALAVLAPVVLSYAFYYLFPRDSFTNYGELLPVGPAPAVHGSRSDGSPFRLADLRGRWVIVMTGAGACEASCQRMLYGTRQARTMQGKERDRVERVWLVADDARIADALLAEHPDIVVVRTDPASLASLPRGPGPLYLVDPLGNQVLTWPRDPDIKALAKDLTRLLKASRIG